MLVFCMKTILFTSPSLYSNSCTRMTIVSVSIIQVLLIRVILVFRFDDFDNSPINTKKMKIYFQGAIHR